MVLSLWLLFWKTKLENMSKWAIMAPAEQSAYVCAFKCAITKIKHDWML